MMRKLLGSFGAAVVLLMTPWATTAAHAGTMPTLTWERSQMQELVMSHDISTGLASVQLLGNSQTLRFALQGTDNGQDTYQLLIPSNFPLGDYLVRTIGNDGTIKDYAQVRVVEFQNAGYNPLTDSKTTTPLIITLFALFALIQIGGGNRFAPVRNFAKESDAQLAGSLKTEGVGRGFGKSRKYHPGYIKSIGLDDVRNRWTIESSRFSTLASRLVSDAGYLQFSLGSLVLFFPVLGALLGIMAYRDVAGFGYITTPSLTISAALLVVSILDAASGFIAAIFFGLFAYRAHLFMSAYDIRTYLGLAVLWISPSLLVNTIRPLRRSRGDVGIWERGTDLIVGSVLGAWFIHQAIRGLDGLAHLQLPLIAHVQTLTYLAGATFFIRYLLEELVSYRSHQYLAYVSPEVTHSQRPFAVVFMLLVKTITYSFFAISFLGDSWQLWLGISLFLIPQISLRFKARYPNSPALFQILPVGIPSLVIMLGLGRTVKYFSDRAEWNSAQTVRNAFLIMASIDCIIALGRHFGREPRAGRNRWYVESKFSVLYRVAGPSLFALSLLLLTGVI